MDTILPSIQSPLGALPARFRRERLLIVGCGDVGQRVLRDLRCGTGAARMQVLALTSSPARVAGLRALGARPLVGNLDDAPSLRRLAGLATRVLHLAPPPGEGAGGRDWWLDPRTVDLARALRLRTLPASGFCAGAEQCGAGCRLSQDRNRGVGDLAAVGKVF